jgi:nucleotide-binding universal stress UspA family protein|uniref:Universal stress protein n=1 Tax=Dictyoglomus turgidum TaxID=513050 RepID=A0A7C3SNY1_9BACT
MKILVPIDGSKNSMEAVKIALKYAKATKTDIYLMTVIPFISGLDLELSASARESIENSMKSRGEEILKEAQNILSAEGVTANTIISSAISAADEIINFAEKEKVDLIIIGSRGVGGVATRFLMGSVASKVVSHAPCSVYVVKV